MNQKPFSRKNYRLFSIILCVSLLLSNFDTNVVLAVKAQQSSTEIPSVYLTFSSMDPANNIIESIDDVQTRSSDALTGSGKRVGIQAGHWQDGAGSTCTNGTREVDINLAVANKAAEILRGRGYTVDVLPGLATAVNNYSADVFIALHSDQCAVYYSGYKISRWKGQVGLGTDGSGDASDQWVTTLWSTYGDATGLPRDTAAGHFAPCFREYYALNPIDGGPICGGKFDQIHGISDSTPGAIIEMGWLSGDYAFMISPDGQQKMATGIANGVDQYLGGGGDRCSGPSLNGPSDSYTSLSQTVSFSWAPVTGCTYNAYTFRIKDTSNMDSGGNTIQDVEEGTTSRNETIPSQYNNQDLYWGVKAANAPNGASWSVRKFRIEPEGMISISPVAGQFFQNPTNGGAFTATPNTLEVFHQTFPVINFNPPSGTVPCSNNTGVGVNTRPFTDVVPQPDGSCLTIIAQGNGQEAGVGSLGNFQAVFKGTFAISGSSQIIFNFFSDDGWILSIGPNADGDQPSYVSGPLINPPSTGPFTGYSIVGSYNTGSRPTQNDLVVNFPAAGTYPFELDYTEGYGGQLALTLKANSQPLPPGGSISGYVYQHSAIPDNLLPGSIVQVCKTNGECRNSLTSATGQYSINGLAPGEYSLTAFPPGTSNLIQSTIGPINLSVAENLQNQNIILTGPVPPPAGTSITSRSIGGGGIPIVYWAELLTLTAQGCVGGTARYAIIQNGNSIRSGTLQESSPGTYTASIQPLYPNHGNAQVSITIECSGNPTTTLFNIYIDPSGLVVTESGLPIQGATVTLYRSDTANGNFETVPNNSGLMSVINRANPDSTDIQGRFGWDVVSGYYNVRAEHPYCASPIDSSQAYVESDILKIPPPVTNIYLVLQCELVNVPPHVNSIALTDANFTDESSVHFTVTFLKVVTGVDTGDFTLTTTGVSGAAITDVSGAGDTYTVTVNTGSGNGTIRLDIVDDNTIIDAAGNPLGGVNVGDGDFTTGETYTITNDPIFGDVPTDYWAWNFIERLYAAGITGGCGTSPLQYCPETTATRSQMAVFLLRGIHGSAYSPPVVGASTGFGDVPVDYWSAAWIKQLAAEGITGGCGSGNYCPEYPVTRDQMAVFLLRSKYGSSYTPPGVGASTGFGDVPVDHWAAPWIKQLVMEGITAGCGNGNYCPGIPVSRAQMAVFLVRTFNLP